MCRKKPSNFKYFLYDFYDVLQFSFKECQNDYVNSSISSKKKWSCQSIKTMTTTYEKIQSLSTVFQKFRNLWAYEYYHWVVLIHRNGIFTIGFLCVYVLPK